MNPYLAGVILGLTLLASYLILGAGLGASARHCANRRLSGERAGARPRRRPASTSGPGARSLSTTTSSSCSLGVFLGGLFSAVLARRVKFQVERGRQASGEIAAWRWPWSAAFWPASRADWPRAAPRVRPCREAPCCSPAAWSFCVCVFAGGYAAAWFVRRQWHD